MKNATWKVAIVKSTGEVEVYAKNGKYEERLAPRQSSYSIEPYSLVG